MIDFAEDATDEAACLECGRGDSDAVVGTVCIADIPFPLCWRCAAELGRRLSAVPLMLAIQGKLSADEMLAEGPDEPED